jgi:hypothetical protein
MTRFAAAIKRMRLRPTAWTALSIAAILAVVTPLWAETRSLETAVKSITRSELRAHVDTLADDTFEGREAGSRGGHAAGGYLVRHLEQLGFKPAGENGSYYQSFNGNCRNILALIEGSDPELKREVIMVGAHYDHVGYGSQRNSYGPWGYIHNGADDNASGTAALLEIAQALRELPEPPRRTVVIAFWDAEEKGLLGSKHWTAHPTVAWHSLRCFVNVDMIGRLTKRRLEVYGIRSAPGLRQLVSRSNYDSLDIEFTWEMKDDSDHWSFFARGLPTIMFHTGLHEDYHRPSDDAERINHEGLEQVSRMLFHTVLDLANVDQVGEFRPESRRETEEVRRRVERPHAPPPPRLGMTWRKQSFDDGSAALQVLSVNRDSAADHAGIRAGDLVTRFEREPIDDDLLFRQQILAAEAPITLTVERTGELPQQVPVKLQGNPVRIGVTCREETAEPAVAIVTSVVYGSPAAEAGLQATDRIDSVNGATFRSINELFQLFDAALSAPQEPMLIRYERRGQWHEVEIQPLRLPAPSP